MPPVVPGAQDLCLLLSGPQHSGRGVEGRRFCCRPVHGGGGADRFRAREGVTGRLPLIQVLVVGPPAWPPSDGAICL